MLRRGQSRPVSKMSIHNGDEGDLEGGVGSGPMLGRSPSTGDSGSGILMAEMDPLHPSGKQKRRRKHSYHPHIFQMGTNANPDSLRATGLVIIAGMLCLCPFLPIHWAILMLVYASCVFGFVATLWLSRNVLSCDDGTAEMRAVSDPIRQGAEGFLHVQYTAIAKFAVPLAGLIVFSYQFRPGSTGDEAKGIAILGNSLLGTVAALGFAFGAICSAFSGYASMWVATQSNIRVASAARRSYGEALVICFRGGAFSAVLNLTLCITGVTSLYIIMYFFFCKGTSDSAWQVLEPTDVPMLLVGYGFGASFVALFMQLGGGIYTKAADVGGKCDVVHFG